MLGVDEGHHAPCLLGFGEDVQRERGLSRGLRTVDLDDAAARNAPDAEGHVEPEGAGGHGLNVGRDFVLPHAHDRALPELLFNLGNGGCEGLGFFGAVFGDLVVHGGVLC